MTAAAVLAHRERQIVEAFRRAGAVTTSTARPLGAVDVDESIAFRKLQRKAVIRPGTQPGTFYVDEPSWQAMQRTRRTVVIAAIALAIAGIAAGLAAGR